MYVLGLGFSPSWLVGGLTSDDVVVATVCSAVIGVCTEACRGDTSDPSWAANLAAAALSLASLPHGYLPASLRAPAVECVAQMHASAKAAASDASPDTVEAVLRAANATMDAATWASKEAGAALRSHAAASDKEAPFWVCLAATALVAASNQGRDDSEASELAAQVVRGAQVRAWWSTLAAVVAPVSPLFIRVVACTERHVVRDRRRSLCVRDQPRPMAVHPAEVAQVGVHCRRVGPSRRSSTPASVAGAL